MAGYKKLFILFISLLSFSLYAEDIISLETRQGVQQKFIFIKAEKPIASVILFAGGKGTLGLHTGNINWGRNNFLVRTRDLFVENNFNVAVVDAPSDRQDSDGLFFGFRDSEEHVTDIDHVITYLRKEANVPVWLIGTSRGTESAATIALDSKQKPHGLILTSSMSVENDKGTAVNELALENLTMPTLIVAHEADGCKKTPVEGSEEIFEMLTNVKKKELKIFSGGDETGNPCKAKSYHGFLDIEEPVVSYISNFIKLN